MGQKILELLKKCQREEITRPHTGFSAALSAGINAVMKNKANPSGLALDYAYRAFCQNDGKIYRVSPRLPHKKLESHRILGGSWVQRHPKIAVSFYDMGSKRRGKAQ